MQGADSTVEGFVDDCRRWREAVGERAPSYRRLLVVLEQVQERGGADAASIGARLGDAWAGRSFQVFYDRPLLLLASLRMRALAEGPAHPLWAAIGAADPDPGAATRDALLAALDDAAVWRSARDRFVQTNETSRAVAWLWPAKLVGCDGGRRPLALLEVGTAAGLNLVADRLDCPWTDAQGRAVPVARDLRTVARVGVDRSPLDARDDGDATWLRACVWVGETDRLARLEAAIAAFRAAPASVVAGDVLDAPGYLRALTSAGRDGDGRVVLAVQTIMRDYLDPRTWQAYQGEMRRWLADAPPGGALWVELEIDHAGSGYPVPVVAHARDGDDVVDLAIGRTGYHPVAVDADEAAVRRLQALFDLPGR